MTKWSSASKNRLRQFGKFLGKAIILSYQFIKNTLFAIPRSIRNRIFDFASWIKNQLDRFINTNQKEYIHTVIFKSETREGQLFDTVLIWLIGFSVTIVILETVTEFHKTYWWTFFILEWFFTIFFTVEYVFRLYASRNALRYATSFFGIVDLLAIIPSYLSIFFLGAQHLIIVRAFRLLRVFRIFKMGHFVSEGAVIVGALKASQTKISVFVSFVVLMSMILGSVLYIVEGSSNPSLDNIPKGIYWAIVTLTTVGYGDVVPITTLGKFLATVVMIMGYGVIAVPTGIVTAEISGRVMNMKEVVFKTCNNCGQGEHHTDPLFCHRCGEAL